MGHVRQVDTRDASRAPGNQRWDATVIRTIVLLVLVGFSLRYAWFLYARPEPVSDFLGFLETGRGIVDTLKTGVPLPESASFRDIGYPIFLALGLMISESVSWLSFLSVLLSTAAIPLTYAFVSRLFGETLPALFAAGVITFYPTLILYSLVLASENLQIVLLLSAGTVLAAGGRRHLLIAGLLFGLAALVRGESLFYLLAVPAILWAKGSIRREVLTATVAVAGVAILVMGTWALRNTFDQGAATALSSRSGIDFYHAHRPNGYGYEKWAELQAKVPEFAEVTRAERSSVGFDLALQHLRANPTAIFGDIALGTRGLYSSPEYAAIWGTYRFDRTERQGLEWGIDAAFVGWVIVSSLALVGVVPLFRRNARSATAVMAFVVANWLCFSVVFWAWPRYRLGAEPFIAVFAGYALYLAAERSGLISRDPDRPGQLDGSIRSDTDRT